MNHVEIRFFVITIHFGPPLHTDRAVASLLTATLLPEAVIVVDHADTPYQRAGRAGHVIVVRPPLNGGYGAGINMGLKMLTARGIRPWDVIIAMNNDIEVYPDTLEKLRQWWHAQGQHGVVGVEIEYPRGTVTAGARLNWLTGRTTPNYIAGNRSIRLSGPGVSRWYIDGAFFAAAAKIWQTLHGMPEHYFLFWEDVLLSERARRQGFPLQQAAGVRVRHRGANQAPRDDKLYYLVRNGALFLEHDAPWPWRELWRVANRLRGVYYSFLSRAANRRLVARALADARKGVTGKVSL